MVWMNLFLKLNQIYDHAKHGWTALCLMAIGLLVAALLLAIVYVGPDPLISRLRRRLRGEPKLESESP